MRAPVRPHLRWVLLPAALASACAPPTAGRATLTPAPPVAFDPARELGELFHEVQLAGVFEDSKTFVDARARGEPVAIVARYREERSEPGFSLADFVQQHFAAPAPGGAPFAADLAQPMEAHIRSLWPVLTRPADASDPYSSLLPLPHPYVVPGGRFREIYYWDSYFTMLGLIESGRVDRVRDMLDNFAHLVERYGRIPNGNRSYYLSRSQPPYLGAMVGLYAVAADTAAALRYLPHLEREHAFWMEGANRIVPGEAHARVVRLRDGSVLNRYWDDDPRPRPESYREDFRLAGTLPAGQRASFYREVRAAAESGWDFSSRWMRDPADLRTLETTELIPVDLNSLLYHTERIIARLRAWRGGAGDAEAARRYQAAAAERRRALLDAAWDAEAGFFFDVRWRTGQRATDRPTLAAAAPLYFGLAEPGQAAAVAARLERDFLVAGGLRTTTVTSGQQWDAPNGWAPLQWLAAGGVRHYGHHALADEIAARWLALNRRTFRATGRMMEKYDVVDPARPAGGGEYPAQDGFGWTNGVALAFAAQPGRAPAPTPQPAMR